MGKNVGAPKDLRVHYEKREVMTAILFLLPTILLLSCIQRDQGLVLQMGRLQRSEMARPEEL